MLLRKDDPWNREYDHPDIRNWRVTDADDRVVGFVETVVINRSKKTIEAILTGANERYAVGDLDIGDRLVRLKSLLQLRDKGPSASEAAGKTYDDAYQFHFRETYAKEENSYDSLKHAYDFGREMALDADYSGLRYDRAQEALRAHWVSRRLSPQFEHVESAVRFSFELTQGIGPYRMTGMEREKQQILGQAGRSGNASERAGAHMATGRPRSSDDDGVESRLQK